MALWIKFGLFPLGVSLKLQPEEGRPSLQISQFKTSAHCDSRLLEKKKPFTGGVFEQYKPAFWRYVEIATPRIPHYHGNSGYSIPRGKPLMPNSYIFLVMEAEHNEITS